MDFKIDPSKHTLPCLLKLTAGNRFMIVKTKNMSWLLSELKKLKRKYSAQGVNQNNIYLPLIEHVHRRGIETVFVDVLMETDNGYDILKEELNQLLEHYGSTRCLNVNSEPVIPDWNPVKGQFNWLTKNQFLNYSKLLNNQNKK